MNGLDQGSVRSDKSQPQSHSGQGSGSRRDSKQKKLPQFHEVQMLGEDTKEGEEPEKEDSYEKKEEAEEDLVEDEDAPENQYK